MFPCCQFPLLINSALPPTSLPSAAAASWFGSLSARAVSDRGPAHRMEGSRTNICLSTSQRTKLSWFWQDSYLLWGSKKLWLKLEMTQTTAFSLLFTLQQAKLPKELKTTRICHGLSLRLLLSWKPTQPGLSETIKFSHLLLVVWHSDLISYLRCRVRSGFSLLSMSASLLMLCSHLLLRIRVTPKPKGTQLHSKGKTVAEVRSAKACSLLPSAFKHTFIIYSSYPQFTNTVPWSIKCSLIFRTVWKQQQKKKAI